jgi:hypothetical protein
MSANVDLNDRDLRPMPVEGVVSQIANSRAPSASIIRWYMSLNAEVARSLRPDPSSIRLVRVEEGVAVVAFMFEAAGS